MAETPEERRDAAVAAIVAAGGSVASTIPLAHAADTGTVVAYRVDAIASDPTVKTALDAVKADTQVGLTGLVPWVDPTIVEEEP